MNCMTIHAQTAEERVKSQVNLADQAQFKGAGVQRMNTQIHKYKNTQIHGQTGRERG